MSEYKHGDVVVYQTFAKWWVGVILEPANEEDEVLLQWYHDRSCSFYPAELMSVSPNLVNVGSLPEGVEWDV